MYNIHIYFQNEFYISYTGTILGIIFLYINIFISIIYNVITLIFLLEDYGNNYNYNYYHKKLLIIYPWISFFGFNLGLLLLPNYIIVILISIYNIINFRISIFYHQYFKETNVASRVRNRRNINTRNRIVSPQISTQNVQNRSYVRYGHVIPRNNIQVMIAPEIIPIAHPIISSTNV
tara:strand:+ start:46090 stop:46620 length:531 start_codon:yes stop_codon:yes gene_type:complete